MNLPTFSALPRAFRCRMSTVLPRVEHESDDARAGTARHAFLQRVAELLATTANGSLEQARALALEEAPETERAFLELIPLETLQLDGIAAEVAVAYDLETGTARELGRGIERRYEGVKATEVVGTIDRLGLLGEEGLYLGDYKGRSHRRKATEDEQLLAGALTAARLYGRRWAEIEVIRLIDGEPFHSKGRVEAFELDSFDLRLQELRHRIAADRAAYAAGDLPPAETGDHCSYCPSLRYCPAKMALARATIGADSEELLQLAREGAPLITEESAARIRQLVLDAEKVLDLVKDAVRDFARQKPFPLNDGSGRWYGVRPDAQEREIVDGRRAAKVLAELFGEDPASAGVDVEVTFSGVERAVKAYLAAHPEKSKRGAITEGKAIAEETLKARGLLRVIQGGKVTAFKPKGEVSHA